MGSVDGPAHAGACLDAMEVLVLESAALKADNLSLKARLKNLQPTVLGEPST